MLTGRGERLWALGGALGAIALLAVGWFFLIGPQHQQTGSLNAKAAAAEKRLPDLRRRLVELREQNNKLSEYRDQLTRDRQALPTESGLSDFLRELQAAGVATGVTVSGLIVGAPTQIQGVAGQVFALPVTVVATGSTAMLDLFLDQLQQIQPRAVLINSINAVPEGQSGSLSGSVTLTVGMQAFVAPPTGAGALALPSAAPSASATPAPASSATPAPASSATASPAPSTR